MAEGARLRPAAGVILYRVGPRGPEVYLLQRAGRAGYLPGFHCFPGGAVDPGDGAGGWRAPVDEPDLRGCALRELFEETGLLLACPAPPPALAARARADLLAGRATFGAVLDRFGAALDGAGLRPSGRWVTPPSSAVRFEARFFLWEVCGEPPLEPSPEEASGGGWWPLPEALERWAGGDLFMAPPTVEALHHLAVGPLEEALARLEATTGAGGPPGRTWPLVPGIVSVPLRTPTLPPSDHTVCVLLGPERVLIVDPGAEDPAELERLIQVLEGLEATGARPLEVVLTHHHPDHVGGAAALRRRGLPIAAHPETARRVPFPVDRRIGEGETWSLGRDPLGAPWLVRALHTPGHAPGHLALFEERRRLLVAGDMLSGNGTVAIHPPEGHLGDYLKSLARLHALEPRLVVPAHGLPFGPGSRPLEGLLEHRLQREAQTLQALGWGEVELARLVEAVYPRLDLRLQPWAERTLLAHLLKLEEEGRACRRGGGWARVDDPREASS